MGLLARLLVILREACPLKYGHFFPEIHDQNFWLDQHKICNEIFGIGKDNSSIFEGTAIPFPWFCKQKNVKR